jgi:plasmid stabilization system protein ParE
MPKLIWSRLAIADVSRLHTFLKSKNEDAAKRAVQAIRQAVRVLSAHPEIGPIMENMPPEFRTWHIDFGKSGYTALYHFDGSAVVLLAVKHDSEKDFQPSS